MNRKNEITLSEKHGLNPCIAECYICGENTGEIVLPGKAGETMAKALGNPDGKMPRRSVFSLAPCKTCRERGIAFVEMTEEGPNGKPTGRRCLIREEVAKKCIQPPELAEWILESRMALLSSETWNLLGLSEAIDEKEGGSNEPTADI